MSVARSMAGRQAAPARRGKLGKMARREEREFYLFISPWIIGFLVFSIGPVIASFVVSFSDWSLLAPPNWIGTKNYTTLINDPLFWQALGNTLYFAVGSVSLGLVL